MPDKNTTPPPGMLKNPVHLLALGFGTGLSPRFPGTAGTVLAVLIYLPMRTLPLAIYLGVVAVMFVAGIWLCARTAAALGVHDPRAIVWDEIVGYLATMTAAPAGWPWIGLGFVLFRLFDIGKPFPVGWVDRKVGGGLGIMLDDLAAALYCLGIMQLIAYLL